MSSLAFDESLEEDIDVGSFNHASVQVNLAYLLKRTGQYRVCSELSLDISSADLSQYDLALKSEVIPDICIYPNRKLSEPNDILRMKEMPILAIEVLSPKQGNYTIKQKFKLYFELGIQSCWLVDPSNKIVNVYSSIDKNRLFDEQDDEVVDEVVGIHLAVSEIFE